MRFLSLRRAIAVVILGILSVAFALGLMVGRQALGFTIIVGAALIPLVAVLALTGRGLVKRLLHDVEQRENRFRDLAGLDPLTELYNRRFLQRRLEEEIAAALRYQHEVSLILFDIDDFQTINNEIGATAADLLLSAIAQAARDSVRGADILGRWGGDELGLLAPRTSAEEAQKLAERLQAEIPRKVGHPGLTLSVGFAEFPSCANQSDTLIAAAETALALARRRRPNFLLYIKDLEKADIQPDDAAILTERLKTATVGTIRALATAVDKRDHYTHGHGKAMEHMLQFLADRLDLDSRTRTVLFAGAELHDVGKIGIPDHILSKPGPLTADEYDIMKRHPEIGKDIVGSVEELRDLVPAILCHHERWDGGGYPHGLKGEQIPLVARLISIADAYHAMSSNRPYRAALPVSDAVRELRLHAGTQFDPSLVEAFVESIAEHAMERAA